MFLMSNLWKNQLIFTIFSDTDVVGKGNVIKCFSGDIANSCITVLPK